MDALRTYRDYGINIDESRTGETTALCPQCSHTRKKKSDKCLSVNMNKETWFCHHCGWKGGLPIDDRTPPREEKKGKPVFMPAVDLTVEAEKYLQDRGISRHTADEFNVKSCTVYFSKTGAERDAIEFPYYEGGEKVNSKYKAMAVKDHTQSKNGKQGLYNYDGVDGAAEIVMTEGELDALSVYECGYSLAVCSCPSGAASKETKNLDNKLAFLDDAAGAFSEARTIILAMDNDDVGIFWRDAIIQKLGEDRCKTVIWPDGCKDANDVLVKHGADALKSCLEKARPVPVPGIMELCDITTDILEYYNGGGLGAGLTTGWRSFEEFLNLSTQSLNILTGIPMSGKSEWLDQLMLNSARIHGWKWAVYSPENHPVVMHVQKLAEKHVNKPMFDKWHKLTMTKDELLEATEWLSDQIKILTFGEKPATADSVFTRLKACKERWGIKGAVIDPYNELDHCRPTHQTETEYVSDFLSRARNFGRLHDMAIWIVAHPTKLQKYQSGEMEGEYPVPTPYDISGSAHWRNKADVCVAVWRSMIANDGKVQIHIQKMRNKNLGRVGMVEMSWERSTGLFSEDRVTPLGDGLDMHEQTEGLV